MSASEGVVEWTGGIQVTHPARPVHGMLPGSHERRGGPECRCGGVWFYWDGMCLEQLKEESASK